jgi:hypothetical protein
MRWLLLALLTSAAALNALALGGCSSRRRSEVGLAAATAFFALLAFPVLLLGYAGFLTARNLALLATCLHVALFFALRAPRTTRAHLKTCARTALDLANLPFDALSEALRARSFAFVSLAAAYAMIAYALLIAVLVPVTSWDGFMYHEPIVGFAIQNHGFGVVDLPPNDTIQATNGYPRLCEALSLWFVIFTDRTLVDLPNVLAAPPLMLGVYALSRTAEGPAAAAPSGRADHMLSLAWPSILVLMPQLWAQLAHVYIDVLVGAFAVTAIVFATRPEYRIRDALVAALALTLLMGSKFSALSMVPVIGAVAAFRLIRSHGRSRPRVTLGVLAGSIAIIAGTGAVQLVHNLCEFQNPIWPASLDIPPLGIRWHGLKSMRHIVVDVPLREAIATAYALPVNGHGDVMDRGYGYAFAWVVFPLGLVATALLGLAAARDAVQRKRWSTTRGVGWVAAITVAGILTAPTLSGRNARYNCHLLAGLMAALTWATRRASWLRVREGMIGATLFLSIFPFSFIGPYVRTWGMTDDLASVLLHPFAHHAYVEHPTFDLLGKERVEELHTGDRVAFDKGIVFVGALWNFQYDNVVHFIPTDSPGQFLAAVRKYNPKWMAAGSEDNQKELEKTGQWELVGKISDLADQKVYRRVSR